MTEWEQIKKEYKKIPVPADGPHQMLEVIAAAKHKRDRWKHIAKYGSIVAAAMLMIVILPGIFLFSGGFGGSSDMAAPESAVSRKESTGSNEWFTKDSAESVMENSNMALKPDTEYNKTNAGASSGNGTTDSSTEMVDADSVDYGVNDKFFGAESGTDSMLTPAAGQESPEQSTDSTELNREEKIEEFSLPLDAVSAEILRQMEERMKETEETYYIKSETCPNGFVRITGEQEYYINEEGLYVIVFEAGKVAPKEQGKVEFVIPAKIVQP